MYSSEPYIDNYTNAHELHMHESDIGVENVTVLAMRGIFHGLSCMWQVLPAGQEEVNTEKQSVEMPKEGLPE